MSPQIPPDILTRSIVGLVAGVVRYPWLVLAVTAALTVAAIQLAYARLEYHTQRNDLLSADKPCQQRWQKYLDAFGDDDDMVVIAEGSDRQQMMTALDAVAVRLQQRPELFDRVFHKLDLRHLQDRALLHLPQDKLEAIRGRIDRMEALLGPVGPVAWRMLAIQSLMANAAVVLENQAAGQPITDADRDLLVQLPPIATAAAQSLRDPNRYRNPWTLTITGPEEAHPAGQDVAQQDALAVPQYFFTPDDSLALLTCRPIKAAQSFTPAKEASAAMRAILAEVGPQFPAVALGLTGLPVLETDEMMLSDFDSRRASWLALLGVAVLYLFVYRGFRYPLLTLTTLVVGTIWALGWATLTVGHLNILSATFAVMLIGMGDYGVLWVAQYDEARRQGESVEVALRRTAERAGPSIATAAATTGLAFFAVMLADFQAVAELGWIAGSGVLLCAASCLILMPALLVLVERRRERNAVAPHTRFNHLTSHRDGPVILAFPTAWLPGLARRPQLVLALGAFLVLAAGLFASRLHYDHNLLNLQDRTLDSVQWEHKLIDRAAGATWDSLSVARSRDEALVLKARYEALPEVGRVVEIASLVPAEQERKLPIVQAIHVRLTGVPAVDQLPAPVESEPGMVLELAGRISRLAGSESAIARACTELAAAVAESPQASHQLREFDLRLGRDLVSELLRLKAVSRPAVVTTADLPVELRERYIGAEGEFLVRAFARDSLWDYEALTRFTRAANTVDPEATGKTFRTLEGLRQMKQGFERAALYALAAIVLVLMFDLRRLADLAMGLFPLGVGIALTLGILGLFGVALNPANMIALPLIVGVGVDNGVHVLHDFRSRDTRRAYRLGSATGRGILVAGLTTVLGFGALMTARQVGMASLGLVLAVGVLCCMIAALVLLPALLQLRDLRQLRHQHADASTVIVPIGTTKAA